jgi:pyridoxamine 5'-phosphate oxidase
MDAYLEGLRADPNEQLAMWLGEARVAGLKEPQAMALATATPAGAPSVRMVLLRGHDERGLVFFTNRKSRKGAELDANRNAAVVFYWAPPLSRQVRAEGRIERVSEAESAAYYASRERSSQIGAWASPQSRPLAGRQELEDRVAEVEERFAGVDVPLPPFWGGYRLVPDAFEMWTGRDNRLHDRARYEREGTGWRKVRLAP